jgi:hypothetical protein
MTRKRVGKIALLLLILNEVRGIVVVGLVVEAWLGHGRHGVFLSSAP